MGKILTILFIASFISGGLMADEKKGHGGEHWKKEHFKKMDTNGDGKISKEEWQKFHDARFTEIDKDADGSVSEDEMTAFHKEKMKEHKGHKGHKDTKD